ncbi:tRNA lysidine(34) synthetase TilS [Siccibacter colletis]|uniref:tRNA lysidine(34) synthetase TilS n=1 Tax=Siccibacter colletis TaxID=1505757 RepID=UPI0004E0CC94|nr:tRNA lysidine(34) synthetase TilS [Siccibacter colletis]
MTPDTLLALLRPSHQFLVAYSGGLDSTVLLHQLVQLRAAHPDLHLRAIHIHHGLSDNADAWAAHCQAQCDAWQVALDVVRVTLVDDGNGIEAQAREARYRALSAALRTDEALVTAQHLDDQCETFLLALKRGSGPAGLAAMPAAVPFGAGWLRRPLLNTPRHTLEQWAQQHGLQWIEDESNQSRRFDRNFLRLDVLPLLNARWPHFAGMVARSAALCAEQEQLLDELLDDELHSLLDARGTLAIVPLKAMREAKRGALLRRWFATHHAQMPSRAALARVWSEVALSREDAAPKLVFGDYAVRRYQDRLWWVKNLPAPTNPVIYWDAPYSSLSLTGGRLSLGEGQRVRAPRDGERVSIRYRAAGTLHIVGRERGRSLKKLWQELGIPPWEREIVPLLFYGEQLISAVGVFVTQEGRAGDENGWQLCWERDAEA